MKIIPIFHHDDGRNLVPTARHIWDALMEDRPEVQRVGTKTGAEVEAVFRRLRSEAERQGEDAFHELHARHQQRLKREQEKGQYAFQVRREPWVGSACSKCANTVSSDWAKRNEPGLPNCASLSKSCRNSSRSFSCEWRLGMANWRDNILKHFQPKISRLTLVADPDGLLTEEGMLSAIRDRGFDLIRFNDLVAFRYAYESEYRSHWDNGQNTDLVMVLRCAEPHLNKLPYDLLKAGRQLPLALHQFFPKLNYKVIAGLERNYLDAVDEAYQKYDGDQLTERGTKEFVLKNCFKIVPDMVGTPVDLLKVLLSLHSCKVPLPDFLVKFLLESLTKNATFGSWPLADMLASRVNFLRFLQDEWKVFLASLMGDTNQHCRVPFSHEDVRAYIDTNFLDGSLTPVEQEDVSTLPAWVRTGVIYDPKVDALRRLRGLRQKFATEIPSADVSHPEWQQAAQRWAELVVLRWEWDEALDTADRIAWGELQLKVEDAFGKWMMNRYGSLHNLPYQQQPVMVHQISRFMAFERNRKKLPKIALLVLDGLAFDQWLLLKKNLEACDKAWRFQESIAFAWVPTLRK